MKILWISNVVFPEACHKLGIHAPVVGGWMQSGAYALLHLDENLQLAVASLYSGDGLKIIDGKLIRHYLIPKGCSDDKANTQRQKLFEFIFSDFSPDIVHIHGTEYAHSLDALIACRQIPSVVSIQGLVSNYYHYYYGGISRNVVHYSITIRDILRRDSLEDQARRMYCRGLSETTLLKMTRHVIGRTTWDRSCVWAINPEAKYHFCNETLRPAFYDACWNYDGCERHSIFLSQGYYPLKGAHQLFKALPLILRQYPDTKVYIAGNNPLKAPWYKKNGYANFLSKLIRIDALKSHVIFLGPLSESEMSVRYSLAHVFVSPSSIENSPNSVGEAQLVGTPVVASYVGGTMDMVKDGETGFLYRFEETSLLAMRICELFASQELCQKLSERERLVARKRHNGTANATQLINIYHDILGR